MIVPPIPHHESARLVALRATGLLDTPPEERFDRYTRMARRLLSVPIALVSLVDANRQWFKSRQGLDATETSREISFCGHALQARDLFVVPDATADERFHDNPLVCSDPNIRFYAAYPIAAPGGERLGTLCVIDRKPRQFDPEDLAILRDLGRMVETEISALVLATVDELTGLSNRRGFLSIAQQTIAQCRRTNQPATLLFIDLDGFKGINDRFGHAEGDRVLKAFASVLLETFRESDVVARLGGDEFCVLLTQTEAIKADTARGRLQACVDALNAPGRPYTIAYSVGSVAYNAQKHTSLEAFLDEADQLMYERKRLRKQHPQRGQSV